MKEKEIPLEIIDPRLRSFQRLLNMMDDLRENCPWDKKQTFDTLRHLTIEETYELSDAILEKDTKSIEGEIGDLLLHMVFYARLGDEENQFNIETILTKICDKLVHRHPHIYGDVIVQNEEEVKANWERLKLKEGKKSILEGVPTSLPALVKAVRIQEKVKGIGFDWDNIQDVFDKVKEELQEFHVEVQNQDIEAMEDEFGDILFSLVNYARFKNINPETALERTNRKFKKRFELMETLCDQEGKNLSDLNLTQMDVYWEKAKLTLKK